MRPLPLGLRIVLLVIPLALMPLAALAGVAYYYLEAAVRADVDRAELRVLSDAIGMVETVTSDAVHLAHAVATLPQVVQVARATPVARDAVNEAKRALDVSLEFSRAAADVTVVGDGGTVILTARSGAPPARLSRAAILSAVATAPRPVDDQRYLGLVDGVPIAFVAHPVAGTSRALVVVDVDMDRLLGTLTSMAGEPRGSFTLVHDGSTVIAATPRSGPALGTAAWEALTRGAASSPRVVRDSTAPSGNSTMVGTAGTFTRIDTPGQPPSPLHVVRLVQGGGLADRIAELRRTALLLAGTAIAFGLIGAGIIARTVVHPLSALLDMTKRIGEGHFNVSLKQSRNDEIGELVGAFNAMAASLAEFQGRLVHAETFAALGRVASTVAHEVRNPLNAMRGCIEYLRLKRPDDAVVQHHAGIIGEEIAALDAFVGDFLKVARLESPQLAGVDLLPLLRTHLTLHEVQAREHQVTFELVVDGAIPSVAADANQLGMVFENLINNAIDAMPRGGELRVHAAADEARVILTFDDTGDGIPAAARRQLFTPFFTTKPGGTGIGLAISRRVVEAHGGSIQCESTEGHGTTFRIALPVQQAVVDEFSSID